MFIFLGCGKWSICTVRANQAKQGLKILDKRQIYALTSLVILSKNIENITKKLDINSIQQLAKSLNLFHIADGSVDLHNESLSNLDYLEYVLRAESNMRLQSRAARLKRRSKLPQKQYDDTVLNSGQLWQIEQLETMEWTSSFQNLLIIGKCATGKTSLAVRIGEKAINSGIQTYYSTADNFITVIRNTEKLPKADSIFNYMKNSDEKIIIFLAKKLN